MPVIRYNNSMTNLEHRQEFIKRLIGNYVHVTEIGKPNPKEVEGSFLYLPLPEYGVSLWLERITDE